jgi:hypothetical protein
MSIATTQTQGVIIIIIIIIIINRNSSSSSIINNNPIKIYKNNKVITFLISPTVTDHNPVAQSQR